LGKPVVPELYSQKAASSLLVGSGASSGDEVVSRDQKAACPSRSVGGAAVGWLGARYAARKLDQSMAKSKQSATARSAAGLAVVVGGALAGGYIAWRLVR